MFCPLKKWREGERERERERKPKSCLFARGGAHITPIQCSAAKWRCWASATFIKVDFQYLTQSQEWSQVMSCHVHLEQEAILWEIDRDWTQLLQVDGEMKQFIVMWNSNRWTMFDHVIVSLAGFSCPQADKTGIPSYFDVALPFLCCSYLDDITP